MELISSLYRILSLHVDPVIAKYHRENHLFVATFTVISGIWD